MTVFEITGLSLCILGIILCIIGCVGQIKEAIEGKAELKIWLVSLGLIMVIADAIAITVYMYQPL